MGYRDSEGSLCSCSDEMIATSEPGPVRQRTWMRTPCLPCRSFWRTEGIQATAKAGTNTKLDARRATASHPGLQPPFASVIRQKEAKKKENVEISPIFHNYCFRRSVSRDGSVASQLQAPSGGANGLKWELGQSLPEQISTSSHFDCLISERPLD